MDICCTNIKYLEAAPPWITFLINIPKSCELSLSVELLLDEVFPLTLIPRYMFMY